MSEEQPTSTILEVFIRPERTPMTRAMWNAAPFLGAAQQALDDGVDIEVFATDTYPSAFEECEPVGGADCYERP